jgi:hypothetical protein
MTLDDKTGGQAFPSLILEKGTLELQQVDGMTVRDWFAGKAVAGLMASRDADTLEPSEVSERVFAIADAMLTERERGRRSGE